ncbi:conserved hypothetical protein [Theileria equi strain WA]|uniref:Uncharacterized protein n=1 Tax=Theileria equi strain WA TaxID=1537102 RepID=L1L9G9_THEEQ|nr:conserved hypothetical protein [Theileria equi strain WA]EKX72141.1 conserved hypothetical protein [Theileria equi strain WA]|eukprot:XP_004831593.1 conserved hypothetical protein [Theileria equi strain WA]
METMLSSKMTRDFETYDALQSGKLSRMYQTTFYSAFNKQHRRSKLSIQLLVTSFFCLAMMLYSYFSNDMVSCTINLGEYPEKINTIEIDKRKCPIELTQRNIYVYYKIDGYPLHAYAGYKLHNKTQFKGIVDENARACFPYDFLKGTGTKKLLFPCGAHPVNVYNDKFGFYSESMFHDNKKILIDQRFETLAKYQDYQDIKDPPKGSFDGKADIHNWLRATSVESLKFSSGVKTLSGREDKPKMTHLLSSISSGDGMENGHFVQWMTPPPFENFMKLYGIVSGPTKFPFYIKFENYFKINEFGGNKYLVLIGSNSRFFSTSFLTSVYLAFTIITFVLGSLLLTKRGARMNCG